MSVSKNKVTAAALFLAGLAAGVGGWELYSGIRQPSSRSETAPQASVSSKVAAEVVELTAEKRQAAGIKTALTEPVTLRTRMEFPGIITLDPDRVVEVRPTRDRHRPPGRCETRADR